MVIWKRNKPGLSKKFLTQDPYYVSFINRISRKHGLGVSDVCQGRSYEYAGLQALRNIPGVFSGVLADYTTVGNKVIAYFELPGDVSEKREESNEPIKFGGVEVFELQDI